MKSKKRIIAGLLAAAVLLASFDCPIAKASETDGIWDVSNDTDISYLQDEMISPVFVKDDQATTNYTTTQILIPEGSEDEVLTYPVMIPEKGAVTFAVMETDASVKFNSLTIGLYKDVSCTEQCGYNLYYYNMDEAVDKNMYCPSAGTYYLKVEFDRSYDVSDAKDFIIMSMFVSNGERNLTEGSFVYSYADYDNKDIMYKIQVQKNSVIAFLALAGDNNLSGYATLYNNKKKALSAEEYISTSTDTSSSGTKYAKAYYTLKKGTYYVKFSNGSSNEYFFAGYTSKTGKDASGVSKAKAAKIKIGGKAKKGMVFATDSTKKTDWYKIKLNKKMAFTIVVDSYVSGKLNMEICDSKGRIVLFGNKTLYSAKYKLPTSGKWSKGTYYIKISKGDNKSCGYYELKVKK